MSQDAYNSYRGYVPHLEFGVYVWVRSKGWKNLGQQPKGAAYRNGKTPTDMERVVTTATTLEEAERQLDNKLKRKEEPKMDTSNNYKLDL